MPSAISGYGSSRPHRNLCRTRCDSTETPTFYAFAVAQRVSGRNRLVAAQRADLRTLASLWLAPVVLIAMGLLFVTLQGLVMLDLI
jgi:hypothetical protein